MIEEGPSGNTDLCEETLDSTRARLVLDALQMSCRDTLALKPMVRVQKIEMPIRCEGSKTQHLLRTFGDKHDSFPSESFTPQSWSDVCGAKLFGTGVVRIDGMDGLHKQRGYRFGLFGMGSTHLQQFHRSRPEAV